MIYQDHTSHARAEAGHTALAAIHNYGLDPGCAVLRGYVEGFVVSYAAVAGWEEAMRVVNGLAALHSAGRQQSKPTLVFVDGEKVA